MATVDLTVAADLSALRSELGKIPGIGADAAAKMTAELNRSIKAAEKAAKQAATASKTAAQASANAAREAATAATAGLDQLEQRAGTLGSSAGKLAGILDALVPGLGEVARTTADVADAGEVAATAGKGLGVSMSSLLGILGPVAVAVTAVAGAYAYLAAEREKADAKQAAAAAAASSAQEASARWAATQERVNDEFAIASGAVDAYTIKVRASNREIDAAAEAQRALLTATRDQARAALEASGGSDRSALQRAESALAAFEASVEAAKTRSDLAITAEGEAAKAAKASAEAQRQAAAAAAQRAQAEAEVARQQAEAEAQLDRVLAQNEAYLGSLRSLQDTARTATEARLQGEAAVEAALQRQIEKVDALAADQAAASEGNAAQLVAIEQARIDAILALEAGAQEQIDALHADALDQRRAEADAEIAERRRVADQSLAASSGLFGTIAQAAGAAADAQVEANQDAALALYGVQKAAAITEATINAALGVSQALALPPPANAIAAAAAAAAGAAQIATIAATPPPAFSDTPGVMQMGNRGAVSLAGGDFFAAAKSATELQRQVGAMSGGPTVLEVRLGHRTLDRSVAQTIRQGGRLSRELGKDKTLPTGHAVRG